MRRARVLLLGLLVGLQCGCGTDRAVHSTSWLERMRPYHGPTGPDVVQMEVALIERPVGDAYLNNELWPLTDEQVVALERKGLLEDNGLRVGHVAGIEPDGLLDLLTSERSCASARRLRFRAGSPPPPLALGPPAAECRFEVRQADGSSPAVKVEQAQCKLAVSATLTPDGRTRLQFTPLIQHGESRVAARPSADGSGWELQPQQPTETYAALGWEISLAPNDYVIIGGRFDRPGTLGHAFFVRADEATPVQRLLVIRTGRSLPGVADEVAATPAGSDDSTGKSPPLALQAAWSAGAGKR